MDQKQARELAERFLAAWNSQDVDTVAACYTEAVVYRDPGTHGEVHGREAFVRYLRKLFSSWKMHWELREAYPLRDQEGAAALWHARLQPASDDRCVEVDGMDLVLVDGDRISRNEVYFDRAVLAELKG